MLKKRTLTALVGIPLIIAAIWFDKPLPWFTILVAVWGLLAVYEFYNMTGVFRLFVYFGLIWTLLFIISPHFQNDWLIPLLLTLAVIIPLIVLLAYPRKERAFLSWAWMLAGILYLGWLLSRFVALRELADGRNWVLFALSVTWASDSAAFFIGRKLGRHKLAPKISPGKSWEGVLGGLLGAVLISIVFFTPTPLRVSLVSWQAILLALAVSVFGQLGDLAESLLKRNTGVKDSGRLVPGHGGFLDRLDSVVFAGVVVYYYVIWGVL